MVDVLWPLAGVLALTAAALALALERLPPGLLPRALAAGGAAAVLVGASAVFAWRLGAALPEEARPVTGPEALGLAGAAAGLVVGCLGMGLVRGRDLRRPDRPGERGRVSAPSASLPARTRPGSPRPPAPAAPGWSVREGVVPPGLFQAGRRTLTFEKGGAVLRVPACVAGRYHVQGVLTAGAHAAVFRAVDAVVSGRPVLLKAALSPGPVALTADEVEQARERLAREAQALLALADVDRVPAVRDLVRDYSAQLHGPHGPSGGYADATPDRARDLLGQEAYLVLSHVPGAALLDLLDGPAARRDAALGAPGSAARARAAARLGAELAALLARLHVRRDPPDGAPFYFVHQSLSPAHVVFTPGGGCFVLDFAALREVRVGGAFDYLPAGSPGYTAPEVYDAGPSDMSDLFSLGATLYHAVAGDRPPAAREARRALGACAGLLELVGHCLLPDPAERRAALEGLPGGPDDPLPADRLRRAFQRLRRQAASGGDA